MPQQDIFTIDCHYLSSELACAYLMVEGEEALFVENNTTKSVAYLLAELKKQGLEPEQVKYLIITHVHLDHAGGTSALLEHCPNATVLAHPKAAKHVINPSRLIASSEQVYGKEQFRQLYGEIKPVDEKRVRIMQDEEELTFGERTLKFIFTRGHANHHFCIYDDKTNGIFTGDTFGIAYPALQHGSRPFLFATTTPTDFHAEEAFLSLDKIVATGADKAYLTHFGIWPDMPLGLEQMRHGLKQVVQIYDQGLESDHEGEKLTAFYEKHLKDFMISELQDRGISPDQEQDKLLNLDVGLNAMGLMVAATRARKKG